MGLGIIREIALRDVLPVAGKVGKADGLDVEDPQKTGGPAAMLDIRLALGIDGWKTDGLDYSQLLAPYSPGAGRNINRVEYSRAYYSDFFEYTRQVLGPDRLISARPIDNYGSGIGGADVAFAPVEITWAGWVGDQDATFDGLKAALNNMYYSAAHGYPAFGSDIGGYREDATYGAMGRSKTLFIRWAQLGAFWINQSTTAVTGFWVGDDNQARFIDIYPADGNSSIRPQVTVGAGITIPFAKAYQFRLEGRGTTYGIPVKVLVLNNLGDGMVRQWQDLFYANRYSGSDKTLHKKDFVKAAEADGFEFARRVTEPGEVRATLEAFVAFPGPAFLEVMVDQSAHVYPMIGPGMGYKDMITGKWIPSRGQRQGGGAGGGSEPGAMF